MAAKGEKGESVTDLRRRVKSIERTLAEILERQASGRTDGGGAQGAVVGQAGDGARPPALDAVSLPDVLPALHDAARARGERLLLVAFADPEAASGGDSMPVLSLADDENLRPLTTLCAAASNPIRARILQALLLHGEGTTTALGAASGTGGGNLYQHLNELQGANLIYQPGRGHYSLTLTGRQTVELLFWCARQARSGA